MTCSTDSPTHLPPVRTGTKIVATIGPASASPATLVRLITAGVNVFRINFSHGTHAEHEALLRAVQSAANQLDATVAIMGDLCGPKIRLGQIDGDIAHIAPGAVLRLSPDASAGNANRVGVNQPEILVDLRAGHRVLIDDGLLRFRVTERQGRDVLCVCEVGGSLHSRKGVNLPDTELRLDCLTDKDRADAQWAMERGLDYLALSFVRRSDDVRALRKIVRAQGASCHIISKIEMPQAVRNLEAVIDASDALLVARGDLGVEMDVATVPRIQKTVIAACRRAGKPVIVATQMLQSMIEHPTPTRAEVSDVANAIVDGADAVMLSGETAIGKYPIEAVEMMRRIAADTEQYDHEDRNFRGVNERHPGVTAAVADSINGIVQRLSPRAVVVWTEEGVLARLISRYRPDTPIVACTATAHVRRRLALYYGIHPCLAEKPADPTERMSAVDGVLIPNGWAQPGSLVVVGIGPHSLEEGDTGAIAIRIVGAGRNHTAR